MQKREIEDLIWHDERLTATQRLVALAICRHYNNVTGQCNPSQGRIAKLTGLKLRTVSGAYRDLRSLGVIETTVTSTVQCSFSVYTQHMRTHYAAGAYHSACEDGFSELIGTIDDTEKSWNRNRIKQG